MNLKILFKQMTWTSWFSTKEIHLKRT